jgi:DNA-binding NarL/FixJ family response regulator
MRDIVRDTVSNEPDMVIVGEYGERGVCLDAFETDRTDVVICGTSTPEEPEAPNQLLVRAPHVKVLMLATSGRRAVMYEFRPHRTPLGDVSPESLREAIRSQPASASARSQDARPWTP